MEVRFLPHGLVGVIDKRCTVKGSVVTYLESTKDEEDLGRHLATAGRRWRR